MNSIKRHKQYAEDSSALIKESKDEVKRAIYARLSHLLEKSGGNSQAYQRLVAADKKNMMGILYPLILKRKIASQRLGKKFGEDRRTVEEQV